MRWIQRSAWLAAALLPVGCGDGSEPVQAKSNPTYYEDIAPIVQTKCAQCHSEGNIAPFALETYDQAKTAALSMKGATAERRMPPWGLDSSGDCNTWREDMSLSEVQIALIANWADTGAPMGDPANAPDPYSPSGDKLDEVSLTIGLPDAYTPKEGLADDYRCFVIDPKLSADRFLTAYDTHPGAPAEVHHVVIWALDTEADDAAAADQDAKEPGLGYTCFGEPGTSTARTVVGWAPGTGVTRYPAGSGLRLIAGRKLVMQVHYHLTAAPAADLTTVDLKLADAVEKEGLISGVADFALNLPPGEDSHVEVADTPFPSLIVPVQVHGVFPHMHKYGRAMRVDLYQSFAPTCLVDVQRYSFEWQRFYFYEEPVTIQPVPGSFRISCTYDTNGAMSTVHWGEGTDDEMCISGFYVTY